MLNFQRIYSSTKCICQWDCNS